ncbi:MerR family transcriptional regulator [bacterium]|nr:MAG: MerR family transcriptional regulator [bacterium]
MGLKRETADTEPASPASADAETGKKVRRRRRNAGYNLSIGEVAAAVGLTTRTVRYYEDMGLLGNIKRDKNGRRIYSGEEVKRLELILRMKLLGLSLQEMQMFKSVRSLGRDKGQTASLLLDALDRHIASIDKKVEQLASLKKDIEDHKLKVRGKN